MYLTKMETSLLYIYLAVNTVILKEITTSSQLPAEYYSQGNGNFRDVSQNRRNDVFFNKDVGEFNVKTFFSLIQADGYNPLEVRPSLFNIKEGKEDEVKAYVADSISGDATAIQNIVAGKLSPGQY